MDVQCRLATVEDIDGMLELHAKYQVDSISDEDRSDGFVTTAFTVELLTTLIEQERGLFLAVAGDQIVGYAVSASWKYCSQWPLFQYMIDDLANLTYRGIELSVENSYQYGPVCVDKSVRGTGVFEQLFAFALTEMANRYPVMVTFVNKANPRSMAAHTQKVGLDLLQDFEFNGNEYSELACLTASS